MQLVATRKAQPYLQLTALRVRTKAIPPTSIPKREKLLQHRWALAVTKHLTNRYILADCCDVSSLDSTATTLSRNITNVLIEK